MKSATLPAATAGTSTDPRTHSACGCGTTFDESPLFQALLTAGCAGFGIGGFIAGRMESPTLAVGLYVASYVSGGWSPVKEVLAAVRARQLDVNLLMILAAIGAAAIGDWGEGAVLLFLFSLSGALEKYTLERTARSIEALAQLRPDTALVIRDGVEQRVGVETIQVGELVRLIPGERLAIDGMVVEGDTTIDQSTITGESMPVSKKIGDEVFAGTLNGSGSVLVKTTRRSSETTLARIVQTVREAQDAKADTARFIERWQKPYVLGVLLTSTAVGLIYYFFPERGVSASGVAHAALYHAMVLLVAASPCAVVIATPAATLAGLTRAARSGILFKGGAFLEKLADISVIAMDKTGTITEGKPKVTAVLSASPAPFPQEPSAIEPTNGDAETASLALALSRGAKEKYSPAQIRILQLAASVEQRSEHPLAKAVVDEAKALGIPLLDVSSFESHTAAGVHAEIAGVWTGVGKVELFESHSLRVPDDIQAETRRLRENGQTALIIMRDGTECGVIGVADAIRAEAGEVIKQIRALGVKHVILLTGDHENVAQAVAREVGADEVSAGLLPEGKVKELARARKRHGHVAMVGDGVNDAPALAAADLGIAMGGAGTDVALDTADVVLMKNDLHGISTAVWLSRRTRAAVSRGLTFAFSMIVVLVFGSMLNLLPLWLAVLCHEGSTVLTIFSGLWLLIEAAPEHKTP